VTASVKELRDQPLRRVPRFFRGIARVERDELKLRSAQRLDAAAGVDLGHRGLGAHLHELALARPGARQRHDHTDLHCLLLLRGGAAVTQERCRAQHGEPQRDGDSAPCDRKPS
jgi:hypothetical protein